MRFGCDVGVADGESQQAASVASACTAFARAESLAATLKRDLARCAALERETTAILTELIAYASARGISSQLVHNSKNHVSINRRHGLIRKWTASDAAAFDGARLADLLDKENTASDVWADTAVTAMRRLIETFGPTE